LPAAELRPQDRRHLRAPGGGVLPGRGRDPPGAQAFAPQADEAQARQRGRCTPSASAAGSRGGQTRGKKDRPDKPYRDQSNVASVYRGSAAPSSRRERNVVLGQQLDNDRDDSGSGSSGGC